MRRSWAGKKNTLQYILRLISNWHFFWFSLFLHVLCFPFQIFVYGDSAMFCTAAVVVPSSAFVFTFVAERNLEWNKSDITNNTSSTQSQNTTPNTATSSTNSASSSSSTSSDSTTVNVKRKIISTAQLEELLERHFAAEFYRAGRAAGRAAWERPNHVIVDLRIGRWSPDNGK